MESSNSDVGGVMAAVSILRGHLTVIGEENMIYFLPPKKQKKLTLPLCHKARLG